MPSNTARPKYLTGNPLANPGQEARPTFAPSSGFLLKLTRSFMQFGGTSLLRSCDFVVSTLLNRRLSRHRLRRMVLPEALDPGPASRCRLSGALPPRRRPVRSLKPARAAGAGWVCPSLRESMYCLTWRSLMCLPDGPAKPEGPDTTLPNEAGSLRRGLARRARADAQHHAGASRHHGKTQRPSLRKRPGVSPTSRLKRAVNEDWLSKPTAEAISARDRSE
jgi:hypothetical protein